MPGHQEEREEQGDEKKNTKKLNDKNVIFCNILSSFKIILLPDCGTELSQKEARADLPAGDRPL